MNWEKWLIVLLIFFALIFVGAFLQSVAEGKKGPFWKTVFFIGVLLQCSTELISLLNE